jgi:formate hydrogenlyase subunit 6/NADH:ubiquinone oxidoreductase subunit I
MKACPTNTLQPAGLAAGFGAVFTPVMVPRRGPCDTTCNACGQVCPTGAIRGLDLDEKRHAKVGTAQILRHRCIAWESGKACLVCDEVCPYGAISLQRTPDIPVAVPVVDERRCNGCGFCEHFCPVSPGAAIVVDPMDALRLEDGSYRSRSRELGFTFEEKKQGNAGMGEQSVIPDGGLPPGFSD